MARRMIMLMKREEGSEFVQLYEGTKVKSVIEQNGNPMLVTESDLSAPRKAYEVVWQKIARDRRGFSYLGKAKDFHFYLRDDEQETF